MDRIYRPDQDVLDARGIDMSVSEVVGLPTTEYGARLRRLNLPPQDAAFVKSLRRRIKNRMASQNSRRRTAEHIRSLTDELRAVRASKGDILDERSKLVARRAKLSLHLRSLRTYIAEKLKERGDDTHLPPDTESRASSASPLELSQKYVPDLINDKDIFECRLDSLVQRSVNHMYRFDRRKPIEDQKRPSNAPKNLYEDRKETEDAPENLFEDQKRPEDSPKSPFEDQKRPLHILKRSLEDRSTPPDVPRLFEDQKRPSGVAKSVDRPMGTRTEKYRRRSLVEIFKLPPIEDGPKIVKAKCASIGCARAEDSNARKPRKRSSKDVKPKRNGCIVHTSQVQYESCFTNRNVFLYAGGEMKYEVLNLSVRERPDCERRHHGRKQAAPRRIAHALTDTDMVLDLKVKRSCDETG